LTVTDPYLSLPWLKLYSGHIAKAITQQFPDALSIFRRALAGGGSAPAIQYFDESLSYAKVDELSSGLAVSLSRSGIVRGDRVALILQNVPQFVVGLIAAWKLGAVLVPLNPMNRERELALLFADCAPSVVICHPENAALVRNVCSSVLGGKVLVLATSPTLFQARNDSRLLPDNVSAPPHADELMEAIQSGSGGALAQIQPDGGDVAVLLYTSGTTGTPKGAMLTHNNIAFSAQVFRDWIGLEDSNSILGIAPLFHVTGIIGHVVLSLMTRSSLILGYRFNPHAMLELISENRPRFTIGAITAFVALMNVPGVSDQALSGLKWIFSGGAPIAPSVVAQFQTKFGLYIHNSYGLTETTSPAILVPRDSHAPVDSSSGALSIGVPVFNTKVRIADEAGLSLPVGELGEIVIRGPQVMAGYWNKQPETSLALREGWLATGDIGFMDQNGWFFLVDRKKDMINAAGYKVWPREVEDVLYMHPAVREAAVVGVADAYRGETVKAVVSLKPGQAVSPMELMTFCRIFLAAYKAPRLIEIIGELPKTVTGKILRRELR
jgi:long-chain acyl-CoA synthetase